MKVNSDFKDLLRYFNTNNVRYLVIGGYAVIYYTEPRYTKDLDIWIDPRRNNASRVFQALTEFGAPLEGMTEVDFTQKDSVYQIGIAPVRVDILMSIEGLSFEKAWSKRVETDFEDIQIHLISRQDLITSKIVAGRPQDMIDVQLLRQPDQQNLKNKKGNQSTNNCSK